MKQGEAVKDTGQGAAEDTGREAVDDTSLWVYPDIFWVILGHKIHLDICSNQMRIFLCSY